MRWPILFLGILAACSKQESAKPEVIAAAVAPAVAPPPRQLSLLEMLNFKTDLEGALPLVVDKFVDTQNSEDKAAVAFGVWAANHMNWADLQKQPETKYALVQKDSTAERGKRLCNSGSLVEIQVDRSTGKTINIGGITSAAGRITRFIAVGSSGELVARSAARLCGIVTGLESYSNSGGGSTHAVHVVGMFDLPENK